MADIYEQHDAAFANVSVFVVLSDAERVASVSVKNGSTGRVTAYVHLMGTTMVRGFAGGGGYDKQTAAVSDAASHMKVCDQTGLKLVEAMRVDGGYHWTRQVEKAGFRVWQVI